jgi:hypothetical protein
MLFGSIELSCFNCWGGFCFAVYGCRHVS